ncbi:hypothetical protein GCM10018965_047270 [Nonomuraea roseola]
MTAGRLRRATDTTGGSADGNQDSARHLRTQRLQAAIILESDAPPEKVLCPLPVC